MNISALEEQFFPHAFWTLFRGYHIYVDMYLPIKYLLQTFLSAYHLSSESAIQFTGLELISKILLFYGACSGKLSWKTTHIIVDSKDKSRLQQIHKYLKK